MATIIQFPGTKMRREWTTVDLNSKRPVDFPDGLYIRAREAIRFVQDISNVLATKDNPEPAIDALVDRLLGNGVMRYDSSEDSNHTSNDDGPAWA